MNNPIIILNNRINPWMSRDLCTYIAILKSQRLLISLNYHYNCSSGKRIVPTRKGRSVNWETWHVENQWFIPYENVIFYNNVNKDSLWPPIINCDSSYRFSTHEFLSPTIDHLITNLIIGFFFGCIIVDHGSTGRSSFQWLSTLWPLTESHHSSVLLQI